MDTQWQPIEMAPKIQSREMLVWDRGYAIAHWVDTVGWIGEDWEVIYPTHFMQLPDPPKI